MGGRGILMCVTEERGIRCRAEGVWALRTVIFTAVFFIAVLTGTASARAETAYGYILPDSSWEYLTYEEISYMPVQAVCYAKNEIYARNGRTFESAELQNYFDQQYWYVGIYSPSEFSEETLNVYETANVALLSQRESDLGGYVLDSEYYDYSVVYQYLTDSYNYNYGSDTYYVDPDSYIFYDSDRRYLSSGEIVQLSLQELCYARNEIYARHGRLFQSQELAGYFEQKNWYWGSIPAEQFSENVLNEYEAANVALLQQEEYARQSGGYILDQYGYSYSGIGSYASASTYTPAAGDYIFWDSNIRYLTDSDVAGLTLQQLNYAKNEIYARRGYIFTSQELRDYFGNKDWYHGTMTPDQFSTSIFNEYELANISLLQQYEYALNPNGYQAY